MTRLWNLPPEVLCQDHLLGEHKEMHQEAGTLVNHPHGEAVVDGHAEKGQVKLSLLEPRHDELVVEMERRGLNHDSPFDYDLSDYDDRGYIDKQANLEDLRSRCEACAERIAAFGGELL
jgi:hypothetical protein